MRARRPQDSRPEAGATAMQITEIYKSLQGESSWAGLPCIFVRLTACNLRCTWCDSEYTFNGGIRVSLEQVEAQVKQLSGNGSLPLVEITGGEPMLQEREVVSLMQRLLDSGYTVLLETSGERPLDKVPAEVVKIVDVKCPHSGAANSFRESNLKTLHPRDEIKFVLSDRTDYEFARDFVRRHDLSKQVANIILSPAFQKDASGRGSTAQCLIDPKELTQWM